MTSVLTRRDVSPTAVRPRVVPRRVVPSRVVPSRVVPSRVVPSRGVPYRLSGALALVAATAAAATFFADGVLTGPAVAVGNARGTALMILVLGVPVLLGAMALSRRGSVRALMVWLGATAYLLYNAVMFLFATPFNHLFLVYVAMLFLALWTAVLLVPSIDRDLLANQFGPGLPARGIGAYLTTIAAVNTLIWLRTAVPAMMSDEPTSFLDEIGLTTSPTFVQDLAFWLPLTLLGGVLLWRRTAWGYVIAGSVLIYGVLEAVGVAVDQWFGYRADPTTSYASLGGVWLFAGLAVVGLVPTYLFLRSIGRPVAATPEGRDGHERPEPEMGWSRIGRRR
jgi:hypothetical protein